MANLYGANSSYYVNAYATLAPRRVASTAELQSRMQQAASAVQKTVEKILPKKNEEILYFEGIQKQIGACGIGNMYNFRIFKEIQYPGQDLTYKDKLKNLKTENKGGCGFLSAAFIDTPECKAMYKHLKENYPLLYQSPIRMNVNSANNFFFCIFDTGEKELSEENQRDLDMGYHNPGFKNGLDW